MRETLTCSALLLLATFAMGHGSPWGRAAEASAVTLEDYLKRMGYEAIEFEHTEHAQPFVEGVLSNGSKRRFLVDTGFGVSALDSSAARGLKKATELDTVLKDSVLGPVTKPDFVVMDKLQLGRAQFFNQPARVEPLRADFITVPYQGVLGYDFLLRNSCLIDCWKHRMYVRASGLSEAEAKVLEETLRLSGFSEIPLQRDGLLSLEVEVNGKPTRLGIDTGSPFEELDDSQLKPLGLSIVKYSQAATGSLIQNDVTSAVIGLGEVGKRKIHVARADTFQMGARKWKDIYFAVLDLKVWGLSKPGTPEEDIKGLLSPIILGRRGALIDVANRKLWLRPQRP